MGSYRSSSDTDAEWLAGVSICPQGNDGAINERPNRKMSDVVSCFLMSIIPPLRPWRSPCSTGTEKDVTLLGWISGGGFTPNSGRSIH